MFVNHCFLRSAVTSHGEIIDGQLFACIPLPARDIFDFESADTFEEFIPMLNRRLHESGYSAHS
jgi:hypothetical protein